MRRIVTLLAAAALTGCEIEEAEYFDPTGDGYRMFLSANSCLAEEAATATRIVLFDLYYSASDEERETLHDRYFYSSRIVDSGNNEWRIIDTDRELIIRTDGQPLSTDGAVWRYAGLSPADAEATITCRRNGGEPAYELRLPDDGGQLSFTAACRSQTQSDGSTRYWCELSLTGSGACPAEKDPYGFGTFSISREQSRTCSDCAETRKPARKGTIRYRIAEPLEYVSTAQQRFARGRLELTAETDDGTFEAAAEYLPDDRIAIACGPYSNEYYWYW